ncbi:hypothetical protein GCM10010486_37110 [Nonomuraea roseoviolacea subsp. carminata]
MDVREGEDAGRRQHEPGHRRPPGPGGRGEREHARESPGQDDPAPDRAAVGRPAVDRSAVDGPAAGQPFSL